MQPSLSQWSISQLEMAVQRVRVWAPLSVLYLVSANSVYIYPGHGLMEGSATL